MRNALTEQLLKAGLVDEQQLRQAEKGARQEQRQQTHKPKRRRKAPARSALCADVEKTRQQKVARDRDLDAERRAKAARKALHAELRELIRPHRRAHNDGDSVYNFVDGKQVKRLYMTAATLAELVAGDIAIVRVNTRYHLVPSDILAKLSDRDPSCVIVHNQGPGEPRRENTDPYADHPIPDDLTW